MENASKALIMAGGVLISLLVISLGVYLFINFGKSAAETHKKVREEQLEQFNSQYTSYAGREDLTIHDVITVANMATQNNIYYELDDSNRDKESSYYIKVDLKNNKLVTDLIGKPAESEKLEFGNGSSQNEILEKNERLIRQHTEAIGLGNFKIKDGKISCMPRIKCEQSDVKISNDTKRVKSITFRVYDEANGYE